MNTYKWANWDKVQDVYWESETIKSELTPQYFFEHFKEKYFDGKDSTTSAILSIKQQRQPFFCIDTDIRVFPIFQHSDGHYYVVSLSITYKTWLQNCGRWCYICESIPSLCNCVNNKFGMPKIKKGVKPTVSTKLYNAFMEDIDFRLLGLDQKAMFLNEVEQLLKETLKGEEKDEKAIDMAKNLYGKCPICKQTGKHFPQECDYEPHPSFESLEECRNHPFITILNRIEQMDDSDIIVSGLKSGSFKVNFPRGTTVREFKTSLAYIVYDLNIDLEIGKEGGEDFSFSEVYASLWE